MGNRVLKIVVLGNCQASVLKACVTALVDADVSHYSYNKIATLDQAEGIAAELAHADLIFSQFQKFPRFGPLRSDVLAGTHSGVFKFPNVVISAFQPDITYLRGRTAKSGPMGMGYHSSIVLAAFMKNYTTQKTRELFNALVYGRLGFYDRFDREIAELDAHFAANGMTVKWPAPTSRLMHTLNHPSVKMLAPVATALCKAAGLSVRDPENLADRVPDGLGINGPVWPIYPPIAQRFGIPGDYDFRVGTPQTGYSYFDLAEMIESSFERYRAWQPSQFETTRVEHTLSWI